MNLSTDETSDTAARSTLAEEDATVPVQEVLSDVYHNMNNPLAVISGNAQLLKEMARAKQMGESFIEPIEDIQAARAEISEALDQLDRTRTRLDPAVGSNPSSNPSSNPE